MPPRGAPVERSYTVPLSVLGTDVVACAVSGAPKRSAQPSAMRIVSLASDVFMPAPQAVYPVVYH